MTDIRPLADADMPALRSLDGWAFGTVVDDVRWRVATAPLERQRQIGAFVDGGLVGHTAAFTQVLTTPGGSVPAAGITWVAVSPAHRRRGVMSTLLHHQLDELHEGGEPVATLWASEPGIYGRFGYGVATRRAAVAAPRGVALGGAPDAGATVVLGEAADQIEACSEVYDKVRALRPGMVSRSVEAWRESSFDDPTAPGPRSSLRCAVAVGPQNQPTGYAWFRTRPNWDGGDPQGTVEVAEILAESPDGYRALLDMVLDLDLMSTVRFWNLPLDHPLLTWTGQTHRLRATLEEQLWVRLVRLDEALAARTYATPIDIVLEVADPACPWNDGRWRVCADHTGATVQRSSDPADLQVTASVLASGYLGDDALHRALAGGALTESTRGAATALARAMRGDVAPWCAYMF